MFLLFNGSQAQFFVLLIGVRELPHLKFSIDAYLRAALRKDGYSIQATCINTSQSNMEYVHVQMYTCITSDVCRLIVTHWWAIISALHLQEGSGAFLCHVNMGGTPRGV